MKCKICNSMKNIIVKNVLIENNKLYFTTYCLKCNPKLVDNINDYSLATEYMFKIQEKE
jgi:hypothetical protein